MNNHIYKLNELNVETTVEENLQQNMALLQEFRIKGLLAYKESDFRKYLLGCAKHPDMRFLLAHVNSLDNLIEKAFDDDSSAGPLITGNSIRVGNECYQLSEAKWFRLFHHLLLHNLDEDDVGQVRALNQFKAGIRRILASLYRNPSYINHFTYVKGDDFTEELKDLVVEHTYFSFIQNNLLRLIKANSFRMLPQGEHKISESNRLDCPIFPDIQHEINPFGEVNLFDFLARWKEFNKKDPAYIENTPAGLDLHSFEHAVNYITKDLEIIMHQCKNVFIKRYNNKPLSELTVEESECFRIPYGNLSNMLGKRLLNYVYLIHPAGVSFFLNILTNPFIVDWTTDPALLDPQKLFKPSLNLGILNDLKLDPKHTKIIITDICLKYYFKCKSWNTEGLPSELISEIARVKNLFNDKVNTLQEYVARYVLKLGVTFINILMKERIFHSTILISTNRFTSEKAKSYQVNNPAKIRLVLVPDKVMKAFITEENLAHPFLIQQNIRKDIRDRYKTTPRMDQVYSIYLSQLNRKVHENNNTTCIIHDQHILDYSQAFTIDINGFKTFLNSLIKGLSLNVHNYNDLDNKIFLTIFNIDPKLIQTFLAEANKKERQRLQEVFDFITKFNNFSKEYETLLAKIVKSSQNEIPQKAILIDLLQKANGYKYSILGMISDSILYSYFNSFIIPTYLDSRGRCYFRNTNLNVQAFIHIKAIVKQAARPLHQCITEDQYPLVIQAIRNIIQNDNDTDNEAIQHWLKRFTFSEERYAFSNLENYNYESRCKQLAGYLINNVTYDNRNYDSNEYASYLATHALPHLLNEDESTILNMLLIAMKDKRKLLIAFSILKTAITFKYPKEYSVVPYPYELDATASGIQMTAILLKSEDLARWSHILPNTYGYDLYTAASMLFNDRLNEALTFEISEDTSQIPVKHQWLLPPYSKTTIGKIYQTMLSLKDIEEYKPKIISGKKTKTQQKQEREQFALFMKQARERNDYINRQIKLLERNHEYDFIKNKLYVKYFLEKRNELIKVFADYPELRRICSTRDLWKKSIMTFGYNSTTRGRYTANVKYFRTEMVTNIKSIHIKEIALLVENHFTRVTQPTLIPDTTKMKTISKIITSSLKPKNNLYPTAGINITNEFLTTIIKPRVMRLYQCNTNSFKGPMRGHQVNIKLISYDKMGNPAIDFRKAMQVFAPNLIHGMDACNIHTVLRLKRIFNQVMKDLGIDYEMSLTTTHDCFAFAEALFSHEFLHIPYIRLYYSNYIKTFSTLPRYNEILAIINSSDPIVADEANTAIASSVRRNDPDPYFTNILSALKTTTHFDLMQLDPRFVK